MWCDRCQCDAPVDLATATGAVRCRQCGEVLAGGQKSSDAIRNARAILEKWQSSDILDRIKTTDEIPPLVWTNDPEPEAMQYKPWQPRRETRPGNPPISSEKTSISEKSSISEEDESAETASSGAYSPAAGKSRQPLPDFPDRTETGKLTAASLQLDAELANVAEESAVPAAVSVPVVPLSVPVIPETVPGPLSVAEEVKFEAQEHEPQKTWLPGDESEHISGSPISEERPAFPEQLRLADIDSSRTVESSATEPVEQVTAGSQMEKENKVGRKRTLASSVADNENGRRVSFPEAAGFSQSANFFGVTHVLAAAAMTVPDNPSPIVNNEQESPHQANPSPVATTKNPIRQSVRRPAIKRRYSQPNVESGTSQAGSVTSKPNLRVDRPVRLSKADSPMEPHSREIQELHANGDHPVSGGADKSPARRIRIDGPVTTEQLTDTEGARSRTQGRSRQRYIDDAHENRMSGPHFQVSPPKRANLTAMTGQFLAYLGVLGLTIGTAIVIYGHFGGYSEYTPTGWLVTTVAQMLLFLGVINLVSGGIEQTNEDVSRRINSLGEQLLRIELVTEEALRGPKLPASLYDDTDAADKVAAGDSVTVKS